MRIKIPILLVLVTLTFAARHKIKSKLSTNERSLQDSGDEINHGMDDSDNRFEGREAEYIASWIVDQVKKFYFELAGDGVEFDNWLDAQV